MTSIVRIVGSTFPKRRDLTQEDVEKYEEDYFLYATNLWKKIGIDSPEGRIIFEKMLQPFVYWLNERIFIEDMEKKNGI